MPSAAASTSPPMSYNCGNDLGETDPVDEVGDKDEDRSPMSLVGKTSRVLMNREEVADVFPRFIIIIG